MDKNKLLKITFFMGYNYFFRFCNIKRKIEDIDINANNLQKIINERYKPRIFQGGKLYSNGKEIGDIKKIKGKIRINEPINHTTHFKKKFHSIPYTEKARYFLIAEIISDSTQYCADLASIIISLKNYESEKLTIAKIADKTIKDWYQNILELTLDDFLKILESPHLHNLEIEKRVNISMKFDKFRWSLSKIGKFFSYHYDYLYTPYRHGMKISFWKDSNDKIFCCTLTKDGKHNYLYISDEKIKKCEEIIEKIYKIFSEDLEPVLFGKVLFPFSKKINEKIEKAPKIPTISFDIREINKRFNLSPYVRIHHFLTDDIISLLKFNSQEKKNLRLRYNKIDIKRGIFNINGTDYILDELWSHRSEINNNEFLIISCCPLAYIYELCYIKLTKNPNYTIIFRQIKNLIFQYLRIKYNTLLMDNSSKISQRINILKSISEDTLVKFKYLLGLHHHKNILKDIEVTKEEKEFFIYYYESKINKLIYATTYMKKLHHDQILLGLIQILIINFFNNKSKACRQFFITLNYKEIEDFFHSYNDLISKITENDFNLGFLIEFINTLFDTTNNIEKCQNVK